ncbi:hypothetical protein [Cognatilysobacter bugurensis]|nr:hypothetical protein [Lysobacter bugurensis]
MGARIRQFDWGSTPLGPIEHWPQSVKTAVDFMLAAPQAVFVFWGSDHLLLFNDASLPILGEKQEWALGQPFGLVWSEIWEDFRPLMEEVMAGKSLYFEDQAIPVTGRPARPIGWFTYS